MGWFSGVALQAVFRVPRTFVVLSFHFFGALFWLPRGPWLCVPSGSLGLFFGACCLGSSVLVLALPLIELLLSLRPRPLSVLISAVPFVWSLPGAFTPGLGFCSVCRVLVAGFALLVTALLLSVFTLLARPFGLRRLVLAGSFDRRSWVLGSLGSRSLSTTALVEGAGLTLSYAASGSAVTVPSFNSQFQAPLGLPGFAMTEI
jgi:hypothetical protein